MLIVTSFYFRALVLLSFILPVGGTLLDTLILADIPVARSELAAHESTIAFVVLGVLNWLVAVVSTIGLLLYRSWARPLSLLGVLLGVVLYMFMTYFISSGVMTAVTWIGSLLGGAVIALAYCSSISTGFAPNNSFKPTPLRGAA